MDFHNQAIATISAHVKSFHQRQVPFRVYHGSTNSTRHIRFDKDRIVDISALNHILSIDTDARIALVEPKVPLGQLVAETLKHSCIPAVVPEFPDITVGGAFAGTGAESSSFRYGYFDNAVTRVEIVIGNGDVVEASKEQNADLFYGSAGAMGTLGITTLLEIQLVPCGKHVELAYHPVSSFEEAVQKVDELRGVENIDFLDGILFSKSTGALVTGYLTPQKREKKSAIPIVQFTRARNPWFFAHVHAKVRCPQSKNTKCLACRWTSLSFAYRQRNNTLTELVPVYDYLFRYDRGSFWMGAHGWAPQFWNRFTRFLLNPVFKTSFGYRFMHVAGTSQQCIIQDLAIPANMTVGFAEWLHNRIELYPLWLCPIKHTPEAPLHTALSQPSSSRLDYSINIGVWGAKNNGQPYTKRNFDECETDNRAIEAKLAEVGGLKWLYAQNFYTEDEFWRIYDKRAYDALRKKWNAEKLPDLWTKVRRDKVGWQRIQPWKGLWYAALKKDHLV